MSGLGSAQKGMMPSAGGGDPHTSQQRPQESQELADQCLVAQRPSLQAEEFELESLNEDAGELEPRQGTTSAL